MTRYTLEHNRGEVSFYNLQDAISSMYVLSQYDSDSAASFSFTKQERESIASKVESGGIYENGVFALFVSVC